MLKKQEEKLKIEELRAPRSHCTGPYGQPLVTLPSHAIQFSLRLFVFQVFLH